MYECVTGGYFSPTQSFQNPSSHVTSMLSTVLSSKPCFSPRKDEKNANENKCVGKGAVPHRCATDSNGVLQ